MTFSDIFDAQRTKIIKERHIRYIIVDCSSWILKKFERTITGIKSLFETFLKKNIKTISSFSFHSSPALILKTTDMTNSLYELNFSALRDVLSAKVLIASSYPHRVVKSTSEIFRCIMNSVYYCQIGLSSVPSENFLKFYLYDNIFGSGRN